MHYINSGHNESRVIDSFNAGQYLYNYVDLQAAFGNDLDAATLHYINYGYFEGRVDEPVEFPFLVSRNIAGVQGNGFSGSPSFSSDGRYVVFSSDSTNLVQGDTSIISDIFIKDLQSGTIQRVSTDANGGQANDWSDNGKFSADVRYVVFQSYATNLVPGDTNKNYDIFVKDLLSGAIHRVSVDANGGQGNGESWGGQFSADGRYVVFESDASNLVPGDTNDTRDIFVKDLQSGAIERISTDANGGQVNGASYEGQFSADGRYVLFASDASNLLPDDNNNYTDIFVKDLQNGTIQRVSTDRDGDQGNWPSSNGQFSADGKYVVFDSFASNLVPGDTNGTTDVFIKDLQRGAIERISTDATGGQGNQWSGDGAFSADGRYDSCSQVWPATLSRATPIKTMTSLSRTCRTARSTASRSMPMVERAMDGVALGSSRLTAATSCSEVAPFSSRATLMARRMSLLLSTPSCSPKAGRLFCTSPPLQG